MCFLHPRLTIPKVLMQFSCSSFMKRSKAKKEISQFLVLPDPVRKGKHLLQGRRNDFDFGGGGATKPEWGVRGPSPENFENLRWQNPHFLILSPKH